MRLDATIFNTYDPKHHNQGRPCLVYLHSHSGSQMEGADVVRQAMAGNFAVCTFDFAGYGKSEGEYGTLGKNEALDIHSVVEHLVSKEKFRYVYLWGRSMGAATVIRYCSELAEPFVKGIILDSPFSDVKTMICDVLSEGNVPRFVTSLCLLPISSTLKDKTGIDVLENSPLQLAPEIRIPSFVMVGNQDTLTKPERVREIFDALSSKLQLN